jgi:hypothetical protein
MTTHMAHHYGTWLSYGGTARMVLAIVLLAAAGGIAYAGIRLPLPAWPPRPSEKARAIMVVTWLFTIAALLVCVAAYVKQMRQEHLFHTPAADPITPVTFIGVGVIFFIIVVKNSQGGRVALTSAVAGALAAPMIFEFPFDLIVMTRTYPPIPPDPALYRVLFFAPLFLVEFTTLALLTLSPMVRLSRTAPFLFALMLGVFAVWGLSGFAYPSTPLPTALNVVSKLLAFAVALSLFFPQRARQSELDQACAQGEAGEVGAAPAPGLVPDPVEMGTDGTHADVKLGGDLGVGMALGDQGDQLPFPGAERQLIRG